MKKKLSLGLVLLLIISLMLLGCGTQPAATSSSGTSSSSGSGSDSSPSPAKPIELKLAHIMSPKHMQQVQVMEPLAKDIEKATEGRVKVTIYPGAALAKPADQFNAAATGIADIAFGVQGYTPGKFPLTSVLALPFRATSALSGSQILWDLYNEFPEIQSEYKGTKVLYLWAGDTGQIITAKKQVKTLEDMKGLKLRSPDPQLNAVLEAWGATPVSMPVTDLYDAMQKGVVEGALAPMSTIVDFNLGDVAKYVTIADVYTSPFYMVMNLDAWAKISADDQKKIDALMGKPMMEKAGKVFDGVAQDGMNLAKQKGMTIYNLPTDELNRWKQASAKVAQAWIKDMAAKGFPAQKIYDESNRLLEKYKK